MFSKIILMLVSFPFSVSFASFRLTWLFLCLFLWVWTWAHTEKHFEPWITPVKSPRILQSRLPSTVFQERLSSAPVLHGYKVVMYFHFTRPLIALRITVKVCPHLTLFAVFSPSPPCLKALPFLISLCVPLLAANWLLFPGTVQPDSEARMWEYCRSLSLLMHVAEGLLYFSSFPNNVWSHITSFSLALRSYFFTFLWCCFWH